MIEEEEKEVAEPEIVPDKSVWRFAIAMGVLVLLLALLNIFSEDIRHLLNPPPKAPQVVVSVAPKPLEKAASFSDEEVKASLTKFIEAFYVDQKKGYFDPPSYFTTITDTYYNYHHLTFQQLKLLHRERQAEYQNLSLTWLVHSLNVERRNDTLVATYWTKQTYTRASESVQEKADILIELKLSKEGKICSLKELDVLNVNSTPLQVNSQPSSLVGKPISSTKPTEPAVKTSKETTIYTPGSLDTSPEFTGGMKKLVRFLNRNLRYPPSAEEQGLEGKVFVYFVVESNGSLSGFKVIRGIGSGCDEEALRVVRLLPPWQAGVLNGVAVRSSYILPITFSLAN
ncbi:MAG: energy transducer TonB [Sphingobacteriaceae bacterium]